MSKPLMITLACAALLGTAVAGEPASDVTQARSLVKELATNLKGRLVAAMQEGGPVNAIEVCHSEAPQIAANLSKDSAWEVGRTSLKVRNPDNAPDAWERKVLQSFEARKAAGEDPATMEFSELVETNGGQTFRYMKAIPTGPVCLNCHGAELAPEVAKQLERLYPEDQARGFQAGDIRGAFTLSKTM
jgi:cytochrome c556